MKKLSLSKRTEHGTVIEIRAYMSVYMQQKKWNWYTSRNHDLLFTYRYIVYMLVIDAGGAAEYV